MDEIWQKNIDFMKSWLEVQLDFWDKVGTGKKTGGEIGSWPGLTAQETVPEPFQSLTRFWSNFISQVIPEQMTWFGKGVGPETYQKMSASADTLIKFMNFWSDMYQGMWEKVPGMKSGGFDQEKFTESFSQWESQYRQLLNQVFSPGLPQSLTWLPEMYKGVLSGVPWSPWTDAMTRFLEPWGELFQDQVFKLSDPTKWSTDSMVELYERWRDTYEKTFARVLRTPGLGYYRETYEKIVSSLDSWMEFNMSLAEFYGVVYQTGMQAMDKLQRKLADMLSSEKSPASFMELYDEWWKTNEETYLEVFRSEEFSRMLGHLVDRGMEFRKRFQDSMEEMWKDLPFPKRSEMDELYKTIYLLKKDVKALRSELEETKKRKGKAGTRETK